MRSLALLLLAALLLAGCSGKDSTGDSGSSAQSSTTTSTGPPLPPPVLTDTLHLLSPPEMATLIPQGTTEARTAFGEGGFGPGGGQQDDAVWSYIVQNPTNVSSGEVRVWIEITETLVQNPFNFPPGTAACTWFVILELGADNEVDVPCLTEPAGPIQAATKELVFPFAGDTTQLEANETILVSFGRNAFGPSLEPSVYVLSGSEAHDTLVQLDGLKEIVPQDD